MAFVNEFVPEDQKDKFDPEVFNLGSAFPPSKPYRWVIDRERDIFLIRVGGSGSGGGQGDGYIPPEFYTLSIQGKLVKFDARVTGTGNFLTGDAELDWEVFNLRIVLELIANKTEILGLIKEAINAIDETGRPRQKLRAVHVNFK